VDKQFISISDVSRIDRGPVGKEHTIRTYNDDTYIGCEVGLKGLFVIILSYSFFILYRLSSVPTSYCCCMCRARSMLTGDK
jgi:hypothetical protein